MRSMRLTLLIAAVILAATAVGPTALAARTRTSPAPLAIHTIPRLPGARFLYQGRVYIADDEGIVRIPVLVRELIGVRVPGLNLASGARAGFARFFGLDSRSSAPLTAAFNVFYPLRFGFADLSGGKVDSKLVSSLTIKSSVGYVRTLTRGQFGRTVWLQGSRVVALQHALENKEIYYTIQTATVDGANVVNRAQQRFLPARRRRIDVQLLFYSAKFSARDALFRFPVGSGIKLVFPSGRVERHKFVSGGELTLGALPRGTYTVSITGPGFSFARPIALSRNQVVKLQVLSYLDIAVVGFLLVSVAIGLPLLRRRHLVARLWGRLRGLWRRVRVRGAPHGQTASTRSPP